MHSALSNQPALTMAALSPVSIQLALSNYQVLHICLLYLIPIYDLIISSGSKMT